MKTLSENSREVGSSAYWGDRGNWLIVLAVHRDSDCLTRSNFEVATKMLEAEGCAIERFNHWAVGWIDYLIINPECKDLVAIAERIRERIDDYPVLDEFHYSNLEQQEAQEIWSSCYRPKERVEYIRKHRSQFEFHGFQDLLGCVRGKYFAGYASELIN